MEILGGLKRKSKQLDAKWFYDEKGSILFDRITTLPEYYPTRTELSILKKNSSEIAANIGSQSVLIDLGSGSSEKVKILLDELPDQFTYMPVDISKEFLEDSVMTLTDEYPNLKVTAICTDYTHSFDLPKIEGKKVVFFPGSTFGNFEPEQGHAFLKRMSEALSIGDGLLMGLDLKKEPSILNRAYNDSAGVTKAFNLNLLERINRELDADFQMDQFDHLAFYNEEKNRIEMHLQSLAYQKVMIGESPICFQEGETIHTENSYKFDLRAFCEMAEAVGFKKKKIWTDSKSLFSILYFQVD